MSDIFDDDIELEHEILSDEDVREITGQENGEEEGVESSFEDEEPEEDTLEGPFKPLNKKDEKDRKKKKKPVFLKEELFDEEMPSDPDKYPDEVTEASFFPSLQGQYNETADEGINEHLPGDYGEISHNEVIDDIPDGTAPDAEEPFSDAFYDDTSGGRVSDPIVDYDKILMAEEVPETAKPLRLSPELSTFNSYAIAEVNNAAIDSIKADPNTLSDDFDPVFSGTGYAVVMDTFYGEEPPAMSFKGDADTPVSGKGTDTVLSDTASDTGKEEYLEHERHEAGQEQEQKEDEAVSEDDGYRKVEAFHAQGMAGVVELSMLNEPDEMLKQPPAIDMVFTSYMPAVMAKGATVGMVLPDASELVRNEVLSKAERTVTEDNPPGTEDLQTGYTRAAKVGNPLEGMINPTSHIPDGVPFAGWATGSSPSAGHAEGTAQTEESSFHTQKILDTDHEPYAGKGYEGYAAHESKTEAGGSFMPESTKGDAFPEAKPERYESTKGNAAADYTPEGYEDTKDNTGPEETTESPESTKDNADPEPKSENTKDNADPEPKSENTKDNNNPEAKAKADENTRKTSADDDTVTNTVESLEKSRRKQETAFKNLSIRGELSQTGSSILGIVKSAVPVNKRDLINLAVPGDSEAAKGWKQFQNSMFIAVAGEVMKNGSSYSHLRAARKYEAGLRQSIDKLLPSVMDIKGYTGVNGLIKDDLVNLSKRELKKKLSELGYSKRDIKKIVKNRELIHTRISMRDELQRLASDKPDIFSVKQREFIFSNNFFGGKFPDLKAMSEHEKLFSSVLKPLAVHQGMSSAMFDKWMKLSPRQLASLSKKKIVPFINGSNRRLSASAPLLIKAGFKQMNCSRKLMKLQSNYEKRLNGRGMIKRIRGNLSNKITQENAALREFQSKMSTVRSAVRTSKSILHVMAAGTKTGLIAAGIAGGVGLKSVRVVCKLVNKIPVVGRLTNKVTVFAYDMKHELSNMKNAIKGTFTGPFRKAKEARKQKKAESKKKKEELNGKTDPGMNKTDNGMHKTSNTVDKKDTKKAKKATSSGGKKGFKKTVGGFFSVIKRILTGTFNFAEMIEGLIKRLWGVIMFALSGMMLWAALIYAILLLFAVIFMSARSLGEHAAEFGTGFTKTTEEFHKNVIMYNEIDRMKADVKIMTDWDKERLEQAEASGKREIHRESLHTYDDRFNPPQEHWIDEYYDPDTGKTYDVHFIDGYGNDIPSETTNAKDAIVLAAAMADNFQVDYDEDIFTELVTDIYKMMNPDLKEDGTWEFEEIESDIFTCSHGCDYYYYYCTDERAYSEWAEMMADGCGSYGEDLQEYSDYGCHETIKDGSLNVRVYEDGYGRMWQQVFYEDETDYDEGNDDAGHWRAKYETLYDNVYEELPWDDDAFWDSYYDSEGNYEGYPEYKGNTVNVKYSQRTHYCPSHTVPTCYGHLTLDIYIRLYDMQYVFDHNLYPEDWEEKPYAEMIEEFINMGGWNNYNQVHARNMYKQDWLEIYEFDIENSAGFSTIDRLTEEDIEGLLERYEGDADELREEIIRYALEYVGKIPYYWGGKAGVAGYDGNDFGSIIESDEKGRNQKGLDCSGFVQWVYWSVTGDKIPGSTAAFSGYDHIDHAELKPGDLGFKKDPGEENNHVGIYIGTDKNGNDLWVHLTGNPTNTVVANNYNFSVYIRP